FPAEAGIRASHVTGVQTCALPISEHQPGNSQRQIPPNRQPVTALGLDEPSLGLFLLVATQLRQRLSGQTPLFGADLQESAHTANAEVLDLQQRQHRIQVFEPELVMPVKQLHQLLLPTIQRTLGKDAAQPLDAPAIGADLLQVDGHRLVMSNGQFALRVVLEGDQHQPSIFVQQLLDFRGTGNDRQLLSLDRPQAYPGPFQAIPAQGDGYIEQRTGQPGPEQQTSGNTDT